MKPCRCWNEPIDGWNPTCLADHCCFTTPDECHDREMRARLTKAEQWDERGVCHECGHWRATHCNADGFSYCDKHYPEGWR